MTFGSFTTGLGIAAPENVRKDEYQWCIERKCRDACGLGVNWECLGSETYRWPKDSDGPLPVQLRVIAELGNVDVSASVEAHNDRDAFFDRAETGAWGQVELDVNSQFTFSGYFQITPKLGSIGSMLYYPPKLFRASRGGVGVVDPATLPNAPEEELVSAALSMSDCLSYPASGVSFEIEGKSPRSTWAAAGDNLTPGMSITTEFGIVGLQGFNPEPDPVTVRAVRRDQTVARRSVKLRKGFFVRVDLVPLSGDEQ
jgi:hypothetical protein